MKFGLGEQCMPGAGAQQELFYFRSTGVNFSVNNEPHHYTFFRNLQVFINFLNICYWFLNIEFKTVLPASGIICNRAACAFVDCGRLVCVCVCLCLYACMCVCVCVRACILECVYVCLHACMRVCMRACVIYIYICTILNSCA